VKYFFEEKKGVPPLLTGTTTIQTTGIAGIVYKPFTNSSPFPH